MSNRAKAAAKAAWSEAAKASAVEQVLAWMAEGKTVKEGVEQFGLGVTPGTVRRWMAEREEWMARYQQAKKLLAYALAEEAITVARESTNHSSAADRVLIETLKWAASKANPAEYGDRQTVEHQGAQTLQVKVVEEDMPVRQMRLTEMGKKAVESAVMSVIALPPAVVNAQKDPDA